MREVQKTSRPKTKYNCK